MSLLRDKLQLARDRYRAHRYPGNLAVDVLWDGNAMHPAERVLEPGPRPWRILITSGLGLAAAAAVAVLFISVDPPPSSDRPRPVRHNYVSLLRVPPKPDTPQNVRFVPASHGISKISRFAAPGPLPGKPAVTIEQP